MIAWIICGFVWIVSAKILQSAQSKIAKQKCADFIKEWKERYPQTDETELRKIADSRLSLAPPDNFFAAMFNVPIVVLALSVGIVIAPISDVFYIILDACKNIIRSIANKQQQKAKIKRNRVVDEVLSNVLESQNSCNQASISSSRMTGIDDKAISLSH